jgi:hypothetical protein
MNTRKHLLVASISLALAACGGGSGGGSDPEPDDQGSSPGNGSNPPEATIAALCDADYQAPSAPVGDIVGGTASSVRNGTVSIYEWNGQGWPETPSQTTTTDNHGRFAFSSVNDLNGPVRFELTGNANTRLRCESPTGCGSTETGEYRIMPLGYKLSTVVSSDALNSTGTVAVTPVTNMAARWAMDMPRGLTPEAMELSAARVQTLFGLDSDFATSLPTAVADCSAMGNASSGDQNHAIISAAFADLAEDEGYGLTLMTEGAAYMYSLLGGQVLTGSGELSKQDIQQLLTQYPQYSDAAGDILDLIPFDNLSLAGLDRLMQSAGDVVSGLEEGDAFSESEGSSLRNRFTALASTWDDRLITNLVESTDYTESDFNTGKALLDEYDGYRQSALAEEAEIDAANRNLGWLYIDEQAMADTGEMVTVISDVIGDSITASICVPILDYYNSSYDCELTTPYSSIHETASGFELRAVGSFQNQSVNLTVDLEDIRRLLAKSGADNKLPIPISGTITNPTAVVTLDGRIMLDLSDNDFEEFPSYGSDNLLGVSPWYFAYTGGSLDAALTTLSENLSVALSLTGDITISKAGNSDFKYSITGMNTSLAFNSRVLAPKNEDGILLSYSSKSTTVNPAGETEEPIGNNPMYTLEVTDPLTLQTAYRFENLGLPPMELEAGGDLTGYEDILSTVTDYITTLLENNPEGSEVDYDAVYAELQTLFGGMDFTSLALNGDNELRIYSEDGNTLETTYSLTTEEDGGISITDGAEQPQATLYIRGVAGYLYTNETLVAVANFGDESEGLLVSLVDGDQRAYPSVTRDDEEALQAATWTLLESLFGDLFTAD